MHTVIVGGGFAGIKTALELSKKRLGKVTLISDRAYFLYHASLYRVATGRDTSASVVSLEDLFAVHPDVSVVQDRMKAIDAKRKIVVCGHKEYTYDTLVIAVGTVTGYFAIKGMEKYSFGIDTLDQARAFKRRVHNDIAAGRHKERTYAIIGAGPTGVELAGALGRYVRDVARAHETGQGKAVVKLVEEKSRILPALSKTAGKKAAARLRNLGVDIITNHKVDSLAKEYVVIRGKKVPADAVVWTSGTKTNPFFMAHRHEFELDEDGRVMTGPFLDVQDDLYVLGDSAASPYAGHARTALRQAVFLADHLERKATGRPLKFFTPRPPLTSIPIGDTWAYVEKYGVYAAGRTGYLFHRWNERRLLKSLLPSAQMVSAIHAEEVPDDECELCSG